MHIAGEIKDFDGTTVASAKEARKLERCVLIALGRAARRSPTLASKTSTRPGRDHLRLGDRRCDRDRRAARGPAHARAGPRVAELPAQRPGRHRVGADRDLARVQGPELRCRLGLRDRVARDRRGGRADQARRRRRDDRGRHRGVHPPAHPRRLLRDARARRRGRRPGARVAAVRRDAGRVRDVRGRRRGAARGLGARRAPRRHDLRRGARLRRLERRPQPRAAGAGRDRRCDHDPPRDRPGRDRAGARRLHQRARDLYAARRRGRDEGDQGRLRRPRLQARCLIDEVDDGPHVRRGRRDRGDHVHPRPPRRRPSADDQLRASPTRRATSTTSRTWRARCRSTSRSRTRWASAATTAASSSAGHRAR